MNTRQTAICGLRLSVLSVTCALWGCGPGTVSDLSRAETPVSRHVHSDECGQTVCDHADGSDHADCEGSAACSENVGPTGGTLVALGHDRRYYAELIENATTQSITVIMLDSHMRELPIGPGPITLNITTGDQTTAFLLEASGDCEGHRAHRFESTDPALYQMVAHEQFVGGKLRVTIDGVPYVGRLAQRVTHQHSAECTHH